MLPPGLRPIFDHDSIVGARLPRNWIDLAFVRFNWYPDTVKRRVQFSCTLKNFGDHPAVGPFFITFGVSYRILTDASGDTIPRSFTHEQRIFFDPEAEIGGQETYTTDPRITTELGFINESPVNKYDLEVFIDSEMQLQESFRQNNRARYQWSMMDPSVDLSRSDLTPTRRHGVFAVSTVSEG